MIIKRPAGTNVVFNENHEGGFLPLPVRVQHQNDDSFIWMELVSAWEPTPDELKILHEGGVIEVNLRTAQMVPIMVSVVAASEPLEDPLADLVNQADRALAQLRRFFCTVLDEQEVALERGIASNETRHQAMKAVAQVNQMREWVKEFVG